MYNPLPSFTYFDAQVAPDLPVGIPSNDSCELLTVVTFLGGGGRLSYFLMSHHVPESTFIFLVPALHSTISPEILTLVLENGVRNQGLGARCASCYWCHCFWAFLGDRTRKCVYININIHISMSISLSVHMDHEFILLLPILNQHYKVHSLFVTNLINIWFILPALLLHKYTDRQI